MIDEYGIFVKNEMKIKEQKTILLVEDDAVISMQESRELKDHGYNVIPAHNSYKAIEAVNFNDPAIDLILMDINLGNNLDGTEVAKSILKNHDIPLLFLSNHIEREVVDKTNNITFYGYVVKDSGISVLDASIKMAFRLHEANQKLKKQKIEIENQKKELQTEVQERKLIQQMIRESEEKYRNVTENIDDFLFTFERIHKVLKPVFFTHSVEKITGYTRFEFLSESTFFLKIIYPDDLHIVKNKLKTILKTNLLVSEEMEFRIINKQGNIVWVRTKINLIRNSDGIILKIYGFVSNISLSKKAEEELHTSTENLIRLNETKDKFISIISHDLRTPFSSILGFTELLMEDRDLTDDERKQYIRFISEASKSMLELVNSLLDLTRIQTGRIKFEPEKLSARMVITNSINSLSGAALRKNLILRSEVDKDVKIYADNSLMTQVFNNLISNAIKFSHEGGEIIITAFPSKKTRFYEFSVKDYGLGIKQKNISELFRIDTKFTNEGTAGEKGSGFGLSIVYEIIEKHGGNIWVESEYGKGTEFKFILPIASPNILLVDDSKTDRLLYSKIIKNFTPDYNIEIASNGKEALEIIKKNPPALVITDHLMPEMNGYDLANEIKSLDMKVKPQVIVLSADIDRSVMSDYHQIGIEYVFHKPVNLTYFKTAVEKSLRKGLVS
jgi:PAS domain S-box-containing protein